MLFRRGENRRKEKQGKRNGIRATRICRTDPMCASSRIYPVIVRGKLHSWIDPDSIYKRTNFAFGTYLSNDRFATSFCLQLLGPSSLCFFFLSGFVSDILAFFLFFGYDHLCVSFLFIFLLSLFKFFSFLFFFLFIPNEVISVQVGRTACSRHKALFIHSRP